jgi:hypothetical protein
MLVIEWSDFSEPWQPARALRCALERLGEGAGETPAVAEDAAGRNGKKLPPRARAGAPPAPSAPAPVPRAVDRGHFAFLRAVAPVFHPRLDAVSLKERPDEKERACDTQRPGSGALWRARGGAGRPFQHFQPPRHARVAVAVRPCRGRSPREEFELRPDRNRLGDLWHLHVPTARAGQYYVYRMDGPRDGAAGHAFDPDQWLLDPYALAVTGQKKWGDREGIVPGQLIRNGRRFRRASS